MLVLSCSEKTTFTLTGKISDLQSDTLLLYYQVPQFKLDTIVCKNGSFNYSFTPDTFTVFSIIFNAQTTLPIFAEKGKSVELNGTLEHLTLKGEGENALLNQILQSLKSCPTEIIQEKVDSIIQTNTHSFTNLFLIEKYYVQNPLADYGKLKELIEGLHGNIKDTPYISQLQAKIETAEKRKRTPSILSLQGENKDGKNIQWNEIRNKYILLNFWASWHPQSVTEQDSLKNTLKAFSKDDLLICNISLDLDKKAWLKAIDEESDQWKQICDFKGWNNLTVKGQGIQSLPANLLLDPNKRVIARDIPCQERTNQIKQLIKEHQEKKRK